MKLTQENIQQFRGSLLESFGRYFTVQEDNVLIEFEFGEVNPKLYEGVEFNLIKKTQDNYRYVLDNYDRAGGLRYLYAFVLSTYPKIVCNAYVREFVRIINDVETACDKSVIWEYVNYLSVCSNLAPLEVFIKELRQENYEKVKDLLFSYRLSNDHWGFVLLFTFLLNSLIEQDKKEAVKLLLEEEFNYLNSTDILSKGW